MIRNLVCLAFLVCATSGCGSEADTCCTPLPPDLVLELEPFVTTGLTSPVFLTQPLNDGRIFVVEQPGRIRIIRDGVLQTTPFLDITGPVLDGGERGLLSVAFHPQYATNRFFYVYFTGANGEIRIERYTATNADVADPATSKLIISVPHSQFPNHNGGLVAFGPDGMLWLAPGDGGGGGDPLGNGQNFNSLLGSMLRIDVNAGDPYAIPAGNPYVGQAGRRPEIWSKGLRNPWRFSFDAATELLYIADVGQNAREEINADSYRVGGTNYGWSIMEGTACYAATTCDQAGLAPPVLDYPQNGDCSVTGGYVYRGSEIDGLQGHYLYSDYCGGWLKSFRYSSGVAVDRRDWGITRIGNVPSFGVDYANEVYMIAGSGIYKIVEGD